MKHRHTHYGDWTGRDRGDIGGIAADEVAVARRDTGPDTLARQWQAELVELARRWEPYGGVPEEEIFVRFGISKPLFDTVLTEVNNRARASRPPGLLVRRPSNRSR
jgi:hypothetical protein